jgi:hypothetical protein
MPNEKSAVDSFLGNLEEADKDPFAPQEDKDPFATTEEPAAEEPEAKKEDKPLPFNKDPRCRDLSRKKSRKNSLNTNPSRSL